ncbi:uncharacterized protein PG998_011991 [Apiospora kogelbergensis]|uniref:uncharacterized protein n=1 Tax=Apiospora kogelbergensis TaxID=1337665 RepID=UPI00312D488D
MLTSVLPFTPEMAATVTQYCTEHSTDVSPEMKEVWDWTCGEFEDADKMSSPLQGTTMKFLASWAGAKRVLEFGAYSGYSALAWYEATKQTQAEIITLELDPKMIAATRTTIAKYNLGDRLTVIEGPAQQSVEKLTGMFDIIFVDANKDGYLGYVKAVLDQKLLSPKGLIMCDNVFARGMTISTESNPQLPDKVRPYWTECGKALQKFNTYVKNDPRIDVVLLPVYDGVNISFKLAAAERPPGGAGRKPVGGHAEGADARRHVAAAVVAGFGASAEMQPAREPPRCRVGVYARAPRRVDQLGAPGTPPPSPPGMRPAMTGCA